MKNLYLTCLMACMTLAASAQSYYLLSAVNAGKNPGGLNSDIEETPAYVASLGWTSILSPTATDTWSTIQNIPFTFNFNGSAVSSFKVSSTGILTFTTSAVSVPSSSNAALPSVSIPDQSICVWGVNLSGANDGAIMKTFGTAPNRQLWVKYASASASGIGTGYTYWSIVLEEGTNKIYIVDERTSSSVTGGNVSLTVGVQVNSSTAISAGSTVSHQGNASSDASDNSFYEFIYGVQPSYDLSFENFDTRMIEPIGQALSAEGTFRNMGSQNVTTFDFNYSVNGGATVTNSISPSSFSSGAFYATVPSGGFSPSSNGTYTIKAWISNINGNPDEDNTNDTITKTFEAATSVSRVVLAEEFSSSTCPPCKTWNDNVYNAALANYNMPSGNKVVVKYQVPIPVAGDPSHNSDADARRTYYGVNAAPTMLVNGREPEGYATIVTWADASAAYTQAETDGLNEPAYVEINNAKLVYDGEGNMANATISADIKSNIDMSSGYRAQLILMSKSYTFNGATNGDFNYHHVMRKMLPSPSGVPLNITAGNTQNVSETVSNLSVGNVTEFSSNLWNHDVEAVIYVEHIASKTIMNAGLAQVENIGLRESSIDKDVKIYPNPAKDQLFIASDLSSDYTYELCNSIGQVVTTGAGSKFERTEINTSDLTAGVYVLTIKAENGITSKRISITK